ncbi:MAG: TIR domain-containing protein [Candidatus Hermodarchaeota archaeon]
MAKWAFLIGVSQYDDEQIVALSYSELYVQMLQNILMKSGEYETVITLSSLGKKPVKRAILREFSMLSRKILPKDTLLIYFIGHGGVLPDRKFYLFPQDAVFSRIDSSLLKESCIPLTWFVEYLLERSTQEWTTFFIIDASRSNVLVYENEDEEIIGKMQEAPLHTEPVGTSFLFACSPGQNNYSFIDQKGEMASIFSSAFIEIMQQGLSRRLTYGMLIAEVEQRVNKIARREGVAQVPYEKSPREAYKKVLLGSNLLTYEPKTHPPPSFPPKDLPNQLVNTLRKYVAARQTQEVPLVKLAQLFQVDQDMLEDILEDLILDNNIRATIRADVLVLDTEWDVSTIEERLSFTAGYPNIIVPESWYDFDVYLHISKLKSTVDKKIQQKAVESNIQLSTFTEKASLLVERGTLLTLVPHGEGLIFNPLQQQVRWYEDIQIVSFRFQAETHIVDCSVLGFVDITIDAGPIGEVPFTINVCKPDVSDKSSEFVTATRSIFESIFISYAHHDSNIVDDCITKYKALGIEILIDKEKLRSGQHWQAELYNMIDKADLFQLYWSTISSQSSYVKDEWQHALSLMKQKRKNQRFIRPLYWEKPMPPAPRELKHLHFVKLDF